MIVVVDYECGNVGSFQNMLRHLGAPVTVSRDESVIMEADGIVLPGVGSFDIGMSKLENLGLVEVLNKAVLEKGIPILGVCLGAQLMTSSSEEGAKKGLNWVDVETVRFDFQGKGKILPIPHMGWNFVEARKSSAITAGFKEETRFYFVHSFHFKCHDESLETIRSRYGYDFSAAFGKDNIMGVQFHPEKSHKHGIMLMKNFTELCNERSRG